MTAPFARDLCGYRRNGNPSTSDNNDPLSIELGHALFRHLEVPAETPERTGVGSLMEARTAVHLCSLRPDLVIATSRRALEFAQYAHLAVFRDFTRAYRGPSELLQERYERLAQRIDDPAVRQLLEMAIAAERQSRRDHELVQQLVGTMPEESLLKIDVTVAEPRLPSRLLVALSSKWSLRTDRAQDCISQGSKLVSLRRGRMPHYAVLTMEPRPAMLRLIASGSGSVDCVYHLALPELRIAAQELEQKRGKGSWKPRTDLERMVAQGRVRDYDELVAEVLDLPSA